MREKFAMILFSAAIAETSNLLYHLAVLKLARSRTVKVAL
jgi:hypothetical protein